MLPISTRLAALPILCKWYFPRDHEASAWPSRDQILAALVERQCPDLRNNAPSKTAEPVAVTYRTEVGALTVVMHGKLYQWALSILSDPEDTSDTVLGDALYFDKSSSGTRTLDTVLRALAKNTASDQHLFAGLHLAYARQRGCYSWWRNQAKYFPVKHIRALAADVLDTEDEREIPVKQINAREVYSKKHQAWKGKTIRKGMIHQGLKDGHSFRFGGLRTVEYLYKLGKDGRGRLASGYEWDYAIARDVAREKIAKRELADIMKHGIEEDQDFDWSDLAELDNAD